MPFMQMENISHFLRACESPPLNMPAHDRFLTVDLYESKDPAQVLQTLGAFSRVANAVAPDKFPTTIGPAKRLATQSPSPYTPPTLASKQYNPTPPPTMSTFGGPMSPALTGGSNASRGTSAAVKSSTGPVSSWSKKGDQGTTNPAWNIHQYGYMGGASQGNQGVAFGARRQITTAAPHVPSLAEKERKRKEKDDQDQRARLEAEEAEKKRLAHLDQEEERERRAEEQKWEQETKRVRDEQRRRLEEQKRQWEEQERKWQAEEEARNKEDAAQRSRATSDARLTGQFLSQYQAEQAGMASPRSPREQEDTPEKRRVRELEQQLQEARERERQYQLERAERSRPNSQRSQPESVGVVGEDIARPPSPKESEASWAPADERENLQRQWQGYQSARPSSAGTGLGSTRPLPATGNTGALPRASNMSAAENPQSQGQEADSEQYGRVPVPQNRTERFLASNPAPVVSKATSHQPAEMGFTSSLEEQKDRERRLASQEQTKAGGWASKSLLEREMERERERQREWEANQQATDAAARDATEGSGEGKSWDVNQYGYTGGDSQNRGSSTGSGIAFGGRRQIIGPRPQP